MLVVAALLLAAALIVAIQFTRLGGSAPPAFPADAPPLGVDLFYTRQPGHAHGLIAYDWSGARRGVVTFPTWVEIARLRPAPDGSGFLLDPATAGDYAAYFDRGGRTLFESDDPAFVSQAWAADSVHACVLGGGGGALITRLPGQADRTVPTVLGGEYTVDACNLRTDVLVASSPERLAVLRPSSGKLRASVAGATEVVSMDASYVALSANSTQPVSIFKVSDLSSPVGQLDSSLQPIAFSGDDSLLLAAPSAGGGSVQAIAWKTGKPAWSSGLPADSVGSVVARPGGEDFVLYLASGTVLVRRDGTSRTFA